MKKQRIPFKYLYSKFFFVFIMLFTAPSLTFSFELEGWHHGEMGYEGALRESIRDQAPLILFFYVDSDESSQRLKDEYFRSYEVYVFLNTIPKADFDLNGDRFEKAIAARYGVDNDPTLIVAFPFGEIEPVKVSPFLEDSDMSTREFIDHLKGIFLYGYSTMAYDAFEIEDYDKAVRYFKRTVEYGPDRAQTYCALASAYHAMAIEEERMDLINLAEENYLKALEINPDYNQCREELERLYENIDILKNGAGRKAQGSGRF